MQDYDVALKNLLTKPGSLLLQTLLGTPAVKWLNVESPKVRNPRRDLLGQTANGRLVGIEIQSRHQAHLGFRIGEYQYATANRYKRMPKQIVLYVGRSKKPLPDTYVDEDNSLRCYVVDIRDLDGEALLASPHIGDNVAVVLTRLGSHAGTVRRIVERIAVCPEQERGEALAGLAILAGLRQLTDEVEQEAKKMLSEREILKNAVFGPPYREGLEKGMEKGIEKGRAEGRADIVLLLLEQRFGVVSPALRKRLKAMKPADLTQLGLKIANAGCIEELFVQ